MSLLSALSVSASGLSAQRSRAELLVENLANAETTRTPEGGPYRRKDAIFTSAPQSSPFSAEFQRRFSRTRASRRSVSCRDTPTRTRAATSLSPASTQPRIWWI